MQHKKKYISDRILEAGRAEYLDKGFRLGNISVIAKEAGVPVGNLYRYFDGKAGLLDAIVKPAYDEIPIIIDRLYLMRDEKLEPDELIKKVSDELMLIFDAYGKDIIILADKCGSTQYEDFQSRLTSQVSHILLQALDIDTLMAELISKAFVNSVFDILRLNLDREKMRVTLLRIIDFYFVKSEIK